MPYSTTLVLSSSVDQLIAAELVVMLVAWILEIIGAVVSGANGLTAKVVLMEEVFLLPAVS